MRDAPFLPQTAPRPVDRIQADINAAAAALRALRTEQAETHFTVMAAVAARIQRVQEQLDRLYEEKRTACLAAGRRAGTARGAVVPLSRRAERLAALVFADPQAPTAAGG